MNGQTQMLKLLACDTRHSILKELLKKPDYTISLAKKLNIESSVITHALKKLENEGLIQAYREKKLKYYEIIDKNTINTIFLNLDKLNSKRG